MQRNDPPPPPRIVICHLVEIWLYSNEGWKPTSGRRGRVERHGLSLGGPRAGVQQGLPARVGGRGAGGGRRLAKVNLFAHCFFGWFL